MYVQFAELPVSDQDRAAAFYAAYLGCRVAADAPMGASGWRWVELEFPGAQTTLHFVRRADEEPSPGPTLVLVDDHMEATVQALKEGGVEIIAEPQPAPWDAGKTVAEFRDSEGNRMVLSSR